MAVTIIDSGTQLAVISTEHTLSTQVANRTYVLAVDLINMVADDILRIRVKSRVLAGGATQDTYRADYGPILPLNKTIITVPLPSTHEVSFTLTQLAGVGRNFDWEVRALD